MINLRVIPRSAYFFLLLLFCLNSASLNAEVTVKIGQKAGTSLSVAEAMKMVFGNFDDSLKLSKVDRSESKAYETAGKIFNPPKILYAFPEIFETFDENGSNKAVLIFELDWPEYSVLDVINKDAKTGEEVVDFDKWINENSRMKCNQCERLLGAVLFQSDQSKYKIIYKEMLFLKGLYWDMKFVKMGPKDYGIKSLVSNTRGCCGYIDEAEQYFLISKDKIFSVLHSSTESNSGDAGCQFSDQESYKETEKLCICKGKNDCFDFKMELKFSSDSHEGFFDIIGKLTKGTLYNGTFAKFDSDRDAKASSITYRFDKTKNQYLPIELSVAKRK
jgi:hypothetical protein